MQEHVTNRTDVQDGPMQENLTNRTYEEIEVGATAAASRTLTAADVEALALATGQVGGAQIDGIDGVGHAIEAPGAASIAVIAGLLNRKLPGPGSSIVSTRFQYAGMLHVGDTLTATVTARSKQMAEQVINFACKCVNQRDEILAEGLATVRAPSAHATYSALSAPHITLQRGEGFAKLMADCEGLAPINCAVVHPCERDALVGAIEAARRDLIVPILIGPRARIEAVAEAAGIDLSPYRIVDVEHSHAAAAKAVELVRSGEAEALMKGSLHTDELMSAVIAREGGLRTARRISHVFVLDVPTYPRLLLVTDAAINISPSLEVKADICRNAIGLAHVLGVPRPKVAVLSAVETVNTEIPGTLDAAALCKMADRGQIEGGIVDGPLAFDTAISSEAADVKHLVSPVAGRADILLVPDLEAGNMLAKQLQYLAGAESAGIVLGARVPIVLTSRADNVRGRLASAAVMKLVAHYRRRTVTGVQ